MLVFAALPSAAIMRTYGTRFPDSSPPFDIARKTESAEGGGEVTESNCGWTFFLKNHLSVENQRFE